MQPSLDSARLPLLGGSIKTSSSCDVLKGNREMEEQGPKSRKHRGDANRGRREQGRKEIEGKGEGSGKVKGRKAGIFDECKNQQKK